MGSSSTSSAQRAGLLSSIDGMRCPRCAVMESVERGAVLHRCNGCGLLWWFSVCRGCNVLARVPEDLEAWRCGCGVWNRSWWRAADGDRDREEVSARVRARRVEESRLLPRPSLPALVGLALALVAGIGLSVLRGAGAGASGGGAGGGGAACAAFRDYRSRVTAGTPASPDLVVERAASASPDVRDAAHRLQAASRASDPDAMLGAVSELTTLCHP